MILIRLDSVELRPAGRSLFRGLSWSVPSGARIGLVGPNGSGKTSLLHLLAGRLRPDAGEVVRARGLRVGALAQEPDLPPDQTVLAAALRLPPPLARVEAVLARLERDLANPRVYGDEQRLARTLARQERALAERAALGGDVFENRVRGALRTLGFREGDLALRCGALSGGQKKLLALAALAADEPDLLLLDEPDNHLDLAAKVELERFLSAYPGSFVIVSHDRHLLDSCVDRIAALEGGTLETCRGGYSAWRDERELRRLRQARIHADQQKEIARIEASIARFERWAHQVVNERHAVQARSRRRRLERMRASGGLVERVEPERRIGLAFEGGRGSRKALEITDLVLAAGDRVLLSGANLLVRRGERVALVGANGCGKSTLLRAVLGERAPRAGRVRVGPGTRVGHYAQEHETLEAWRDRTPLELVRDVAPIREEQAVSLLLRLLFSRDQLRRPIGVLSGGERSRLQLARLMLETPDLLLLDEPTNHLDIPSAEVLEEELARFEGAVVLISHDRYFADALVDRVVAFEGRRLVSHACGYTEYLERRRLARC